MASQNSVVLCVLCVTFRFLLVAAEPRWDHLCQLWMKMVWRNTFVCLGARGVLPASQTSAVLCALCVPFFFLLVATFEDYH